MPLICGCFHYRACFCDFLNDLKSLYRFLLLDVSERYLHSELVHMAIIAFADAFFV